MKKKLNEKKLFNSLKKLFSYDEIDSLKKYIVYEHDTGYTMYDEYNIDTTNDIVIEKINTFTVKNFYNLRNAVIWATLDKCNKIEYAREVEELDLKLASTISQIELQQKIQTSTKSLDAWSLSTNKLNEEEYRKQRIYDKLDKYSKVTKNLQERIFKQASNN